MLDEDGNFNMNAIFSRDGLMRQALTEYAALMQARNGCLDGLDEALRDAAGAEQDLQILQDHCEAALESNAPDTTLGQLRVDVEKLKGLVQRAKVKVEEERKHLKNDAA